MTRPDPALVRECFDANRPRLMAVVEAIKIIIPAPRKDK